MCMFTSKVFEVSDTKILATKLGETRRGIVYQMKTSFENPTAMVLPIPVKHGYAPEFFDFSNYDTFFYDMKRLFPEAEHLTKGYGSRSLGLLKKYDRIEVVSVGAYIASFVPSRKDFNRLDECFQLDTKILEELPYDNFSFIVAQLDPKESNKKIHPLAFSYEIANKDYMFIPTVHVHDNSLSHYGDFDHDIYVGWDVGIGNFRKTPINAKDYGKKVDLSRTHGLISEDGVLSMKQYQGSLKNGDIIIKGNNANLDFFSNQCVDEIFYGQTVEAIG